MNRYNLVFVLIAIVIGAAASAVSLIIESGTVTVVFVVSIWILAAIGALLYLRSKK